MPHFLLVTLAAPMASFGSEAGHERRGSRERPGKSALVGLLGAALGIRRHDRRQQQALAGTIEAAVRVEHPGQVMQDFHTAQYVPTARIRRPQTRREALAALKLTDNAELTRRDYRTNVLFTAAYARNSSCPWTMEEMADALRRPVFTLYLGRKSCPLSLPLDPRIVEADNLLQALAEHADSLHLERQALFMRWLSRIAGRQRPRPYAAVPASHARHANNYRLERRNDQPLDRTHWHFTERYEAVCVLRQHDEEEKQP